MQLHGLTQQQIDICNELWSMQSESEVMEWFDSLPDMLKFEAYAMINLIMYEEIDQIVSQQSASDMHQAQKVLSKFY